jgi:hypothetical protein
MRETCEPSPWWFLCKWGIFSGRERSLCTLLSGHKEWTQWTRLCPYTLCTSFLLAVSSTVLPLVDLKRKKIFFDFFFFLWYWVLSSGPPSCRQTIYHLCYAPSLMFAFTGFLAYVKFSIVKCFIMTFPKTHGVYLGHIHLLYCSFWTLSEGVLLCSPGCPQTYNPPAFTSHVLGLQARTTVPRKEKNF